MSTTNALLAAIPGADHRDIGGLGLDIVRTGGARVKRIVYPPGFRWSVQMKPVVGTDLCMHAHVGFLAQGRISVRYADGCTSHFVAPQVIAVEPGHDGWVDGNETAVLIEFDFEGETVQRLGMPAAHTHGAAADSTR
jgi:hypothetical protein